MTEDERQKQYKSIIAKKCVSCFRRDECMLFSSSHAGIQLCLGPFKDEDDRTQKLEEDWAKEDEARRKEIEADLGKFLRRQQREDQIEEYWVKMLNCELSPIEEQEDDE